MEAKAPSHPRTVGRPKKREMAAKGRTEKTYEENKGIHKQ